MNVFPRATVLPEGRLAQLDCVFSLTAAPMTDNSSTNLDELYNRPGIRIRRAHQIAVSVFEDECRAFDLTTTQFGVIFALSRCPGIDQATLGRLLGLDRSNIALVVSNLVGRDIVVRAHHPVDRRRRVLNLSEHGLRVLGAAMPFSQRAIVRLLAPFTAEEAQTFVQLTTRLVDHFTPQMPLDPPDPELAWKVEDLCHRPGFQIRRARQVSAWIFARECEDLDITTTQFGVLFVLRCCPGIDQITLARLLGFDRSTTGLVVDHLENKELLRRRMDPEDRRRRMLNLTAMGEQTLSEAVPCAARARARLLEAFDTVEGETFIDLLGRLLRHHNEIVRVPMEDSGDFGLPQGKTGKSKPAAVPSSTKGARRRSTRRQYTEGAERQLPE